MAFLGLGLWIVLKFQNGEWRGRVVTSEPGSVISEEHVVSTEQMPCVGIFESINAGESSYSPMFHCSTDFLAHEAGL